MEQSILLAVSDIEKTSGIVRPRGSDWWLVARHHVHMGMLVDTNHDRESPESPRRWKA